MASDILAKIKQANLIGRGGACYPTALKWQAVKEAAMTKKVKPYIVINAAEGEPGILKDGFILANYPERVLEGVRLAWEFLGAEKIYFYINPKYYQEYKKILTAAVNRQKLKGKLEFFVKPEGAGYIGGEETTILNLIEGQRLEPRLRPPFPTEEGLFGRPTLINNVETFYNVSLVNQNEYYDFRFYSLNGALPHPGVFVYPSKWTIKRILVESDNWPNKPFFVQVGGDASGEVLNSQQLEKLVSGAGSITVYDLFKTDPKKLMLSWFQFFKDNSCGQCTPCREGTYRLWDLLKKGELDQKFLNAILSDLEQSSFCALGAALPVSVKSYLENVWNDKLDKILNT
ncbi:MAG TPA: NADH-ubiquinone oxidoreductase-F iron-sulfur binding region domain-containing protein [bacterium]|nr:NADH-ubiquinone oxidoreductase-F iron-sulfur binding region domain-containing protein [bacterium]HPT29618.1 NADH-ubiquinone oxidoreductase-F iron-sulfur binding region domain-containing protein [bacterium]